MCFEKIIQSDYVVEPSFTTDVTVFKSHRDAKSMEVSEIVSRANLAANIVVANIIVKDALVEVAKYPTVVLNGLEPFARLQDRSIALMSQAERRLHALAPHVHAEQLWVTPHSDMTDKVIVLQLADFSCLVEYSLGPHRVKEPMPENALLHWELRIKTHLTSESGTLYERAPGWEELLIAMREDK
jgi:hypothetical protein